MKKKSGPLIRGLAFAAAVFATTSVARATEIVIPHVGRLTKAGEGGDTLVNGTFKFRFGLYRKSVDSSGETSLIWEETYKNIQVANGTYAVDLGVAGDGLATIDIDDLSANDALWLELTLFESNEATTGIKLSPRTRLAASPLAHYAHDAGKLGGKGAADYLLKADFETFKTDLTGGSSGGGISIPWAKITEVPGGFEDGTDDGLTEVAVAGALSGTGTDEAPVKIRDASIDATLLGADSVTTPKLLDGAVTSTKLALGAVGTDQIATNAVGAGKIAAGAVGTDQLAANAVGTGKIAASAVTAAQIADATITTAKYADASITKAKLATGAVDASVFTANSITLDKLAAKPNPTAAACLDGKVLKAAAGAFVCADDVGGTSTPNFNVTPPLATAAGSPFTLSINNGGVGTGLLADGAVATAKLADNAVAGAKLADNAVVPAKLALDGASLARVSNNVLNVAGSNVAIGTTAGAASLSFGGETARTIGLERKATGAGSLLALFAGAAQSGGTDLSGGELRLSSGLATGAGTSTISFFTAGGGTPGTADKTVSERMRIDGNGNLGLGSTNPNARLVVRGGAASASITVGGSGIAIPLNSVTATGPSGWTAPLAVGDLITISGNTRQIVSLNATTVNVDKPFSVTAPLASVSFTYQQPVARMEASDGSLGLAVTAAGTTYLPGVLDAPNAIESVAWTDARISSGTSWTGCRTCVNTTTTSPWVQGGANWGVNRLAPGYYTTQEGDVDGSSWVEIALTGNSYRSVLMADLDWVNSRWADVYLSTDNGTNYSFARRIHTYKRENTTPFISTIRTLITNLPVGPTTNLRVRVVASRGRLHWEGFGLSKVNLPQDDDMSRDDTPWIPLTFGSNWANYGNGYAACAYRRQGGRVYFRGLANTGSLWTSNRVITSLPVGFRPAAGQAIFTVMANSNAAVRVDMKTNGDLAYDGGGANTGWLSLEGISFEAQQQ